MTNYIRDSNRWHLATPPPWWQQQLFDYDPLLVLIPSRQGAFYHLGRRSRTQLSPELLLHAAPDTKMLASYGLVPVTKVIRAGLSWDSDTILQQLRMRDIYRAGGADAMADRLDALDKQEYQHKRDLIRADMDHRSRDGWRSYQARTGQRTRPTIQSNLTIASSGSTA